MSGFTTAFLVLFMIGGGFLGYRYYRQRQKERMRENVRDILATYIPLNDMDLDMVSGATLNQPLTEI
jgi:hypothetical protein